MINTKVDVFGFMAGSFVCFLRYDLTTSIPVFLSHTPTHTLKNAPLPTLNWKRIPICETYIT